MSNGLLVYIFLTGEKAFHAGMAYCQHGSVPSTLIFNFESLFIEFITGTGAVSLLFHLFPYGNDAQALQYVALTFHLFNFALFMAITVCAIARYVLFRQIWISMLHHPVQSLFIGPPFPKG